MTCGPWKAIRLETFNGRLADLWTDVEIASDLSRAKIIAHAQVEGTSGQNVSFTLSLDAKVISVLSTKMGNDRLVKVDFDIESPALWYPSGYGMQPLYEISATLSSKDVELHTLSKKIGLRRAELIQDKDKYGKSFYFRVNHVDVFCGGSDWIPADSFTPRISDEKYRRWLELMVDGNQCMVRVWGGGIWEPDVFYSLCDELGIMVWQDFMFGISFSSQPFLKFQEGSFVEPDTR